MNGGSSGLSMTLLFTSVAPPLSAPLSSPLNPFTPLFKTRRMRRSSSGMAWIWLTVLSSRDWGLTHLLTLSLLMTSRRYNNYSNHTHTTLTPLSHHPHTTLTPPSHHSHTTLTPPPHQQGPTFLIELNELTAIFARLQNISERWF